MIPDFLESAYITRMVQLGTEYTGKLLMTASALGTAKYK